MLSTPIPRLAAMFSLMALWLGGNILLSPEANIFAPPKIGFIIKEAALPNVEAALPNVFVNLLFVNLSVAPVNIEPIFVPPILFLIFSIIPGWYTPTWLLVSSGISS